nr:hypothetical protein [Ktedonobacter sp. SOSP1-85]
MSAGVPALHLQLAFLAAGPPGFADERPEIEHRPVDLEAMLPFNQERREPVERSAALLPRQPDRPKEADQEPCHVYIEESFGPPVHDGQYRARRVGADAPQAL